MKKPSIHIAMITYNGEQYLPDQLASLSEQSYLPKALWVSDDQSSDQTLAILQSFGATAPFPVHIYRGPLRGAAANMASLIDRMPEVRIASCDQDDIWRPDRLMDADNVLSQVSGGTPTVHVCSREERSWFGHKSPYHGFLNSLVENKAPGNASVFNSAAVSRLKQHAWSSGQHAPYFDWWAYQFILGIGGGVVSDARQGLSYRAHGHNVLGPRWSCRGFLTRAIDLLNGSHWCRIIQQALALRRSEDALLDEHKFLLRQFISELEAGKPLRDARRSSIAEHLLLRGSFYLSGDKISHS